MIYLNFVNNLLDSNNTNEEFKVKVKSSVAYGL